MISNPQLLRVSRQQSGEFGFMMQMMAAPTPEGSQVPMMSMVAKVVRSDSLIIGWLYHVFNSAVIGAIFGWLLGNRATTYRTSSGWGVIFGLGWWVLGGLVLMPILLGMPAFAPLAMAPMRMVAIGSIIGHVVFGLITGLTFVALTRRGKIVQISEERPRRAA